MYQYKVDNLTIGSHKELVFKEGRVVVAKLTLPSSMPFFWNTKVELFSEGKEFTYNLGPEVGNLDLKYESGFFDNCVTMLEDPNKNLAKFDIIFKTKDDDIIPWVKKNYFIAPENLSIPVREFSFLLKLQHLPKDTQRIILKVQGECTPDGLHNHTAWCIILVRKEFAGGLSFKWIIL